MENPLGKILQKPNSSGRLVSWSIELSEFDIDYLPRGMIKGKALAGFVAEFTGFPPETTATPLGKSWLIFVDGSACRVRGVIGVCIVNEKGEEYHQ